MSNRASQRAHQRRMSRLDRRTGRIFFGGFAAMIVALVICFAACTSPAEQTRKIHDELVYFKDHRTDLCFAFWMSESDSRNSVMASVPCEKVMHLLTNGPERGR